MGSNFFLAHLGAEPIIYGLIITLGLATIWWKLISGKIFTALVEIFIFYLVFSLHGGTMTGGMAAAVAALIGGWLLPALFTVRRWTR